MLSQILMARLVKNVLSHLLRLLGIARDLVIRTTIAAVRAGVFVGAGVARETEAAALLAGTLGGRGLLDGGVPLILAVKLLGRRLLCLLCLLLRGRRLRVGSRP